MEQLPYVGMRRPVRWKIPPCPCAVLIGSKKNLNFLGPVTKSFPRDHNCPSGLIEWQA